MVSPYKGPPATTLSNFSVWAGQEDLEMGNSGEEGQTPMRTNWFLLCFNRTKRLGKWNMTRYLYIDNN